MAVAHLTVTCFLKFNSLSIHAPSSLTTGDSAIGEPHILILSIDEIFSRLRLDPIIMNSVLSGFNFSQFVFIQF